MSFCTWGDKLETNGEVILLKRDKNMGFFLASASVIRKANYISFLETEDETRVNNIEAMCGILKDFFWKFFLNQKGNVQIMSLLAQQQL